MKRTYFILLVIFCLLFSGCSNAFISDTNVNKTQIQTQSSSNDNSSNNITKPENSPSDTQQDDKQSTKAGTQNGHETSSSGEGQDTDLGSKQAGQTGQDAKQNDQSSTVAASTVSISVKTADRVIIDTQTIEIDKDSTVFDILQKAAKKLSIPIDFEGFGASKYIMAIDNIYEFDMGPESGWMYKINGKVSQKGCGIVTVSPGDKIEWIYTLNLGKDIGANLG